MATAAKGKRGKRTMPERTLEQVALDEFGATGDVTGLGVLADWVDEFQPERAEFAGMLREVAGDPFKADGVRFFWNHAGSSYTPGKETAEQGKFRGAYQLRKGEEWLGEYETTDERDPATDDVRVVWEQDMDYSPDNYGEPHDMPEIGWDCLVQCFDGRRWNTLASLSGITFAGDGYPNGDPYKRVVEAELALEVMGNG